VGQRRDAIVQRAAASLDALLAAGGVSASGRMTVGV
jgi:hypothetical protein